MSLIGSNWHDVGYYVDDGYGGKGKVENVDEILEAAKDGTLYESDVYSTSKVYNVQELESKLKTE